VVSGVKWLAFSKVLIQLFRWISTFWVIRLLNAEDYGVMAIVEIMVALLVSVNYLCIGNAIIRFKTLSKPVLNTLLTCCLLIGMLLFSIQFFSANYFSQFYQTAEAALVLQVISIAYIIECFNVKPMALMAKGMQFKLLAKIDMIAGISMPIAVLACAYAGLGYWALAIGHLVNAVMKTLVANVMYRTSFKLGFRFRRAIPMLKFGAQNAASSIVAQINSSLDFIIGGYYFSTSQIGSYQVGLQISFIPLRKISPELRRISFPAYSKISHEYEKIINFYKKSNRLISFIIFPLFWGLGYIAEPLISVFLTDKWLESAQVVEILCFVLPFKLLTETSSSMLNAMGRADILLKNTLFAACSFVISILFLIDMGVQGLAYAWVISILLTYALLLYRITIVLPIKLMQIIFSIKEGVFGALLMVFFLYISRLLIDDNTLLSLVLLISIGGCTYGSYVLLWNKKVIIELKGLIK